MNFASKISCYFYFASIFIFHATRHQRACLVGTSERHRFDPGLYPILLIISDQPCTVSVVSLIQFVALRAGHGKEKRLDTLEVFY